MCVCGGGGGGAGYSDIFYIHSWGLKFSISVFEVGGGGGGSAKMSIGCRFFVDIFGSLLKDYVH